MAKTKLSDEEALRRFEQFAPETAQRRDRSAVADIEQAVSMRKDIERTIERLVVKARHDGLTWTEIASALGVSHQAAIQRYRDKI